MHQLAMYVMDFDALNRAETVTITDASGATLDSQSVSNFSGGRDPAWNGQGQVTITVTNDGGPNAVVSGLFFGPPVDPSLQAPSGLTAARGSSAVSLSWDAESAGGVAGQRDRQPIDGRCRYANPIPANQSRTSPITQLRMKLIITKLRRWTRRERARGGRWSASTPRHPPPSWVQTLPHRAPVSAPTGLWALQFGGAAGNILPHYIDLTDNGQRYIWQYGPTQTAAMQNGWTDPNGRNAACDYSSGHLDRQCEPDR